MPGQTRSRTASVLVVSFLLALLSLTAEAQIRFDLPAQPLAQALTAVGNIANLNIYFDATTVDGIRSPALKAELSADDALAKLLAGTRLHAVRVDDNTFRVVTETDSKRAQGARDPATGAVHPPERPPASMHLASAGTGSDGPVVAESQSGGASGTGISGSEGSSGRLDEVIVSAEKRDERLQDVPVPVTAISADALLTSNQVRIQDFYTTVPGLSLTPDDNGGAFLTIRGITTGFGTNPAVGVMVDEVPYGAAAASNDVSITVAPDIDPSELARVEVLRGPQGTLYGAGSMGGLLKFVTIDPSTAALSGHLQVGGSGVFHGDQLGYNVRGSINVPLSDTLAIRASAFTREDPGYIENLETGQRGVNSEHFDGGRLAALWQPSQDMSLKLTALLQRSKADGSSYADIDLGDLQQNHVAGTGQYDREIQAYSATLKAKLGSIDLTSVTGYGVNSITDSIDLSPLFAFPGGTQDQFGVAGTAELDHIRTNKFTQEVRLSASIGDRFDWLLGGFFDYEKNEFSTTLAAMDPATGARAGDWLDQTGTPASYREYSAFADVTFHITGEFDVQLGGRETQIRQTSSTSVGTGPYITELLGDTSPQLTPGTKFSGNAFTYLVTPRWRITSDLMLYARLASGYRPGGSNSPIAASFGFPAYKSDTTENYEIGFKGDILNRLLTFDASVYYIDWKDIQLSLYDPQNFQSYNSNASRAKSQGVELSVAARPLAGLTLSAWVELNDAELTRPLPTNDFSYGLSGDRLPFSARFSGNVAVDDEFPLGGSVTGFAGATLSYTGNREGIFASASDPTLSRQNFPAYARTDVRAGVRYDTWTFNLFITNIADKRAVLNGGIGTDFPGSLYYIQPRTAGLSLSKTF